MSKTIELKATGETMTFTNSGSNGEFAEIMVTLPGTGEGPPTHRHVLQSELFEAVEGRLGLECEGEKMILKEGESFCVPANALHTCYAVDGEPIKFKATFKPALNIEYAMTEIFASCNRQNAKDPSPIDACYVMQQTKGEYYLGDIPTFIQNTVFPLIAWGGKAFGLVKANPRY